RNSGNEEPMPRPKKPARLQLRKERVGGQTVETWVIRDGTHYERPGCARAEYEEAEKRFNEYIDRKYEPPRSNDPHVITVADMMNHYVVTHCPTKAGGAKEVDFIKQLIPFWASKTLYDVDKDACKAYTAKRKEMGVTD